jgi:hypothetical protein
MTDENTDFVRSDADTRRYTSAVGPGLRVPRAPRSSQSHQERSETFQDAVGQVFQDNPRQLPRRRPRGQRRLGQPERLR